MISKSAAYQAESRKRDRFAIAASVVLMLGFGFYFFVFKSPLARCGSVLVILSAAGICLKLLRRGATEGGPPAGGQLIRQELRDLEKQAAGLRIALLAHVLPLLAGFNLFCFGLPRPGAYKIVVLVSTVLICLGVYLLSHRRLTRQIRHLRSEIEQFANTPRTALGEPQRH